MAERCVYHGDFEGALYHRIVANMIHRTLKGIRGRIGVLYGKSMCHQCYFGFPTTYDGKKPEVP